MSTSLKFECNVCGQHNTFDDVAITERMPGPICSGCNSGSRFRWVTYSLSKHVFGTDGQLPAPCSIFKGRKTDLSSIKGIGVSDAHIYSKRLEKLCNYTNTFYHQAPFWDVTQPSEIKDADL